MTFFHDSHPSTFSGRLAIQQRLLPVYRVAFLEALAAACQGGLSVFAGKPLPHEAIAVSEHLHTAHYYPARNHYLASPGSPLFLCYQPGIRRWLEEWQPDALIVEANPRYLSTPQACNWMHVRRRPVLGWGLGISQSYAAKWNWLTPLRNWRRRTFLRLFDGMVAYSQAGAESYRQLGFPAERVFIALNAVAPRPSHPPPIRPLELTRSPVVLFVGRLQARKRIDLLIQACAALPPALQPRLLVVGDGPALVGLQELARSIYPATEFLGARRGHELAECFAAADVFVLPGSGGLAVQEAMSWGLPVIVAEGDGTQDDLVRESNGWRVPPGDLHALTECLRDALSDITRLRRMGEASYQITCQEVNVESMVAVFVRALNQIREQIDLLPR